MVMPGGTLLDYGYHGGEDTYKARSARQPNQPIIVMTNALETTQLSPMTGAREIVNYNDFIFAYFSDGDKMC